MPTFPTPSLTKLTLPSTADLPEAEQAWVKVRTKVLLGDIVAAREDGNGDVFQIGLAMLSRLIAEWNYVNPDGSPIPITLESLNHLDKNDYEFLDAWINEHLPTQQEGLAKEEKKDSISTSTPLLTDVKPPSSPLTAL